MSHLEITELKKSECAGVVYSILYSVKDQNKTLMGHINFPTDKQGIYFYPMPNISLCSKCLTEIKKFIDQKKRGK